MLLIYYDERWRLLTACQAQQITTEFQKPVEMHRLSEIRSDAQRFRLHPV
jgi:hypothetical protein